jgi:hypothetical protein
MYKTVYDQTQLKFDSINGLLPLYFVFFIIGAGLIFNYKYISRNSPNKSKGLVIGWIFLLFSGLLISVFLIPQFLAPQKAKRLLKEKKCLVVEGKPENFHTIPPRGNGQESFDMNGVHFHYSDYHPGFGYNNAYSLGGVINPDNFYRITYYPDQDPIEESGHSIIKIEVLK